MSRVGRNVLSAAVLIGAVALLVAGCGSPPASDAPASDAPAPITPTLVITSVKQGATAVLGRARQVDVPTFTGSVSPNAAYVVSGPPDAITVTLKKIALIGDFGTAVDSPHTAWEGSQALAIAGAGDVDASGISGLDIPAGTITAVELTVAPQATVTGSITGKTMYLSADEPYAQVDVYTKAAYSWDASAFAAGNAGGTTRDYTAFTPLGAEPMAVSIHNDPTGADLVVTTPSSATVAAGDAPVLTILFDISRALRFYNGMRPITESDGGDGIGTASAYFFAFGTFSQSVAAFIGEAGRIQGYAAHFNGVESGNPTNWHYVPGWMTLVFDPAGTFLSGLLMCDNDLDWVISKGIVRVYDGATSLVEIQYSMNTADVPFTLQGLVPQSTVDEYTPIATWDWPGTATLAAKSGEAYFQLKLQQH